MGSSLSTYACCIADRKHGAISRSEKHQYAPLHNDDDKMAADHILTILQTSTSRSEVESKLKALQKDTFNAQYNWESVAARLLDLVKLALEKGTEMSEVMKKTYEDVKGEYEAWRNENPDFAMIVDIGVEVMFTVLALAVLAALLPWVIDALGFGCLGPRLGSWAARWQSIYLGETPSGSLFSFLQKIGMKYNPKAMVAML